MKYRAGSPCMCDMVDYMTVVGSLYKRLTKIPQISTAVWLSIDLFASPVKSPVLSSIMLRGLLEYSALSISYAARGIHEAPVENDGVQRVNLGTPVAYR